MAKSAAGIASLLASAEAVTAAETALGAVSGNVADIAAFVAFLATAIRITGADLGAFTRDMPRSTAAVARLWLRSYSAFSAWTCYQRE